MAVSDLAEKFRRQQEFSAEYSPLYACLFGTLADWLDIGNDAALIAWLTEASRGRDAFDVPLLLLAGLHRDILDGVSSVASLARYYPTVGGSLPCGTTEFAAALRDAMMARRNRLAQFMQTATVQTNETGRGIIWLVPLFYTGWDAVHLVDLGASAGLNLVADERAYHLVAGDDGRVVLDIGRGEPIQFLIQCHGKIAHKLAAGGRLPGIVSRTGCDIAPLVLKTAEDALTLSAFVWGDQPQRLQRLREGIAAFHAVNRGGVPVRLHAADLPDELTTFLIQHVPREPQIPVVIYNSYMTIYLKDKGAGMRRHIKTWAATQTRPVLWLQWEPEWGGPKPPQFGWISWTAELWRPGRHDNWRLAWVHPHGTQVQWEPGIQDWIDSWRKERRVSG